MVRTLRIEGVLFAALLLILAQSGEAKKKSFPNHIGTQHFKNTTNPARHPMQPRVSRTLAIIKPDAVTHHVEIFNMIEDSGLSIVRHQKIELMPEKLEAFYAEHKERPFFADLLAYMSSGPVHAAIVEGPGAVAGWRRLLGPTDSEEARRSAPGSVRALFGKDKTRNAAHGSDSVQSAVREIGLLFQGSIAMVPHAAAGQTVRGIFMQPEEEEEPPPEIAGMIATHPRDRGVEVEL